MKVFVSYKRDHAESEALLSLLETELPRVYSDRLLTPGEWRPRLLQWIDRCDLFVVLLSGQAIESEEVREEVHRAYDRWVTSGRQKPAILPVGVRYSGPFSGFRRDLEGFHGFRWRGEEDNQTLLAKIRLEAARRRRPRVYATAIAALVVVALLVSFFGVPRLRDIGSSPGRLPVTASGLSVRRITDVGDVGAVAVSRDAKTVFINRSRGVDVTDVNGAVPRKLFDTFGATIACGEADCYMSGVIDERPGVYRFSATRPPVMLFSGVFTDIDLSPAGDRLILIPNTGDLGKNDVAVRRIEDGSQTVEKTSPDPLLHPSWHPDGESMLYVERMKEAVTHDLASGKQTRLPRPAASIFDAAWETRGRYVLAYTLTATVGEFWILQPDRQPIGPILRDEVRYHNLRATPLPDTFSAVRSEDRSVAQLASLERPFHERPIGRLKLNGPFAWTGPDRMLFTAKDETGSWIEEYDIHAQQVRRLSPAGFIGNPMLTPDDARLVFSMDTESESGLWTSPVGAWNPVKLAQLPILTHAISPDSEQVAFVAFGPEGGLYVTPLKPGGEVRRLTRGSIWEVSFAGPRTIVFKRDSDGRRPLCKISRDGGPESCFAVDGVRTFAVSPDRKTVVAVTHPGNSSRLHFIDIASGAVGKVVTVPGWIETQAGIAWTPGDSRIVYVTQKASQIAVESYRTADGAIEVVSPSSEGLLRHLAVSPDGRYVVFLRMRGSSDAVLVTVTP